MRALCLSGRGGTRAALGLILFFLLLLPASGALAQEQVRQPALSDKPGQTAYVDHSRLRAQFPAMKALHENARTEWAASEEVHRKALREAAEAERAALEEAQRERRRRLHARRAEGLRALEAKLAEAIRDVASGGGFTEIRPLPQGPVPAGGADVTDLVLSKLN